MRPRIIFLSIFIILFSAVILSAKEDDQASNGESDQQINDFSLSGFGDKGKKSWDLKGKTADIFDDVVKLDQVVGNMYNESETVKLTADKGDFNKVEGKVHLEKDVVITTSSGAKLTTDSLDWDRKNQLLSSDDRVYIEKENMVTTASGILGHPNLNQVSLQKDVQVEINPTKPGQKAPAIKNKIIITCDGPMEIDYAKNVATFKNNVKADNEDAIINCDIMDVYFGKAEKKPDALPAVKADATGAMMNSTIDKLICRGNVKISKGENVSYSQEAIYNAADKRIVLTGKPKLIISSTDDLKGVFGSMQ